MIEKTWQKNAPSQITLNSIFAALGGVLIAVVIQDKDISNILKFVELVLLFLAFLFFAVSAEATTNALDEKDVKKYVYYMIWYNFGVVLIGASITIIIYAHFADRISCFISRFLPIFGASIWPVIITFLIVFIILLSHWLQDIRWLLFARKVEFSKYLDELEDRVEPESDPSCLMKLFYKCKDFSVCNRPHDSVYTRLAPSNIHGVGVFAIRDIPKDANIFSGDSSKMVWVDRSEIENSDVEIKKLYDDFCIIKGNKYCCPDNFNNLTVGWYLNESTDDPNVRCDEKFDFYALRDIKKGEELTVDYSTFSEYP